MNVKIYRFNPEIDKSPYYDTFQVEVHKEDRMTVMYLLEYVGDYLDGTLSLYMHSVCGKGICESKCPHLDNLYVPSVVYTVSR